MKWDSFKQGIRGIFTPRSADALDPDVLKEMARGIMTARPDEIGCAECFEQMDQFVEIELAGKNAADAMPLVKDHLNRCHDCREEFEALLTALRSVA
ncbi:MAG TPA: hypothetical protein VLY63_13615 [Anaerolineae bacterium]|nr:hypothetical protein [Anaerolineae bacterium]